MFESAEVFPSLEESSYRSGRALASSQRLHHPEAETGVEHPCAILESELITLFHKMIIVGFFGFFFSDEANSWASITFLQVLVTDHSSSAITGGSVVIC